MDPGTERLMASTDGVFRTAWLPYSAGYTVAGGSVVRRRRVNSLGRRIIRQLLFCHQALPFCHSRPSSQQAPLLPDILGRSCSAGTPRHPGHVSHAG